MSIFRSRKKFTISERDPLYKVRYLGNVQTALMKGDGCADKATGVLWNNFNKSNGTVGIDMKLQICATGLKAQTKEQGLTDYHAHRISYCIAHPKYPKVFVWVYRHEGKRMKVELRCHAVLCKTEAKAKTMAVQLHEKLTWALQEFMREKTRRQNVRLTLQRTRSIPLNNSGISGVPLRKKFLTQGQNFKPPIERSPSAPKLGDITEDHEGEVEEQLWTANLAETPEEDVEEDEPVEGEEFDDELLVVKQTPEADSCSSDTDPDFRRGREDEDEDEEDEQDDDDDDEELAGIVFELEMGNDIEALKQDADVQYHLTHQDSDDNSSEKSSESGFSEKDDMHFATSQGHAGSLEGHEGSPTRLVKARSSPMGSPQGQSTSPQGQNGLSGDPDGSADASGSRGKNMNALDSNHTEGPVTTSANGNGGSKVNGEPLKVTADIHERSDVLVEAMNDLDTSATPNGKAPIVAVTTNAAKQLLAKGDAVSSL